MNRYSIAIIDAIRELHMNEEGGNSIDALIIELVYMPQDAPVEIIAKQTSSHLRNYVIAAYFYFPDETIREEVNQDYREASKLKSKR